MFGSLPGREFPAGEQLAQFDGGEIVEFVASDIGVDHDFPFRESCSSSRSRWKTNTTERKAKMKPINSKM